MTASYFVHTNRHKEEEIDLERLFEDVGVVATFSEIDAWGEQLADLEEGDRVFAYDKESREFLGVGIVEAEWDGEPITDPADQVALLY